MNNKIRFVVISGNKKQQATLRKPVVLAGALRFELRRTVLETAMLPLHHAPSQSTNLLYHPFKYLSSANFKFFGKNTRFFHFLGNTHSLTNKFGLTHSFWQTWSAFFYGSCSPCSHMTHTLLYSSVPLLVTVIRHLAVTFIQHLPVTVIRHFPEQIPLH